MALLVGELYALLLLEKKAFMKGLKEAEAAALGTSRSMSQAFVAAGKMIAVGLGVAVVAIGAIGAVALSAAVDFERGMANVQTLMGKGSKVDARIAELGESVKQMSLVTGKSLEDLQRGLYDIIGTFTDTADTARWLELSAKAGAAGMSTTHDAILLLSAVTKSYGDTSFEAAQKAADLVFQTANLGVTTFPQMAASMGKVLPIAAALKVSQEELFGAMATLTGVSGDTAEVVTQLRSVMTAFLKPNTMMTRAIAELGYESGAAMVEQLGLSGSLKAVAGTSVTAEKGIAKVFGRVESLTAVLALNGAQAADWVWKTEAMRNAAGMTARAFEIQQATAGAIIDRIGAALGVLAVNIGNKLMPAFKDFLTWIEKNMPNIVETVLEMTDAFVIGFGIVASVIGAAIGVIGSAWKILGDIGMQGPLITAAILAIAVAFGAWAVAAGAAAVATIVAAAPVILVIAAIGAAIWVLVKYLEAVGVTGEEIFSWLGDMAQNFVIGFLGLLSVFAEAVAMIPGPMQEVARTWKTTIHGMQMDVMAWGDTVADAAKNAGSTIVDGVMYPINQMNSAVTGAMSQAGIEGGASMAQSINEALKAGLPLSAEQAAFLGEDLGEEFTDEFGNTVTESGLKIGTAMKTLFETFGGSLKSVAAAVGSGAGGTLMAEMAKAISENRNAPINAMTALLELMETSMSPLKEIATLAGQLADKALAAALKDNRPDVVAQANAVVELSAERLGQMVVEGGDTGRAAMKELDKAIRSKVPAVAAAAAEAKKQAIIELYKAKYPAGLAGAAAGGAFGSGLQNAINARRYYANVWVKVNGNFQSNSIGGYATGAWNIPKDQLAFIHQGEMVVPAAAANRIRKAAAQPAPDYNNIGAGTANGAGTTVHNHLTVQGLVKARNPFEIVKQQQRLADFSVLKWPQAQEIAT